MVTLSPSAGHYQSTGSEGKHDELSRWSGGLLGNLISDGYASDRRVDGRIGKQLHDYD